MTDVAAKNDSIKNRLTRDFGPSHCSSKPLARQSSNRWCSIGFANVLLHHFFTFVFSKAM
jgi:hypothetical protein